MIERVYTKMAVYCPGDGNSHTRFEAKEFDIKDNGNEIVITKPGWPSLIRVPMTSVEYVVEAKAASKPKVVLKKGA